MKNSFKRTISLIWKASTRYFPLLLLLFYIMGITLLMKIRFDWNWLWWMSSFMGSFFLVFSFFKILNLSDFAKSFAQYDIVAKRSNLYAKLYPFFELILGVLLLLHTGIYFTNLFVFILMGLGMFGVVNSLMRDKREVKCACLGILGTFFKLPVSYLTLMENVVMIFMSCFMLFFA